jgi:hypothetical protein
MLIISRHQVIFPPRHFLIFILPPWLQNDYRHGVILVSRPVFFKDEDMKTLLTICRLAHNTIQRNLYLELVKYWIIAIEQATSKIADGKIYGQQVVTEWAKK